MRMVRMTLLNSELPIEKVGLELLESMLILMYHLSLYTRSAYTSFPVQEAAE
jgi:hypothetical protein